MNVRCLVLAAVTLFFTSCVAPPSSGETGPGIRPALAVLMPVPRNDYEARHLPQVFRALERHGYNPVSYGYPDLRLQFTIETGPVNADATITLLRGSRIIARAFGRDGGPRIIMDRSGVVLVAVDRALRDLDVQLGNAGPGWGEPVPYGPMPRH